MVELRPVLLAVLIACGGTSAGTDGALADAPPIDGPPLAGGLVTVTVTNGGAPLSGIGVLFQAADSSIVATVSADGSGEASAQMPGGGYVTVSQTYIDFTTAYTYAGVSGGEHLVFDFAAPADPTGVPVSLIVPSDPGAQQYLIATQCDATFANAGSSTVFLSSACPTADITVTSLGSGRAPLRGSFTPNVAIGSGAVIAITAPYEALHTTVATFTDVPAGSAVNLVIAQRFHTANGRLGDDPQRVTLANSGGSAALALVAEATAPIETDTLFIIDGAEEDIQEWGPVSPSYTLDVGATMLPAVSGPPAVDMANRRVTWTSIPHGGTPNLVGVELVLDGPGSSSVDWYIAARTSATSVTYPAITGISDHASGTGTAVVLLSVPGDDPLQRAQLLDGRQLSASGLQLRDPVAGERVVVSLPHD